MVKDSKGRVLSRVQGRALQIGSAEIRALP